MIFFFLRGEIFKKEGDYFLEKIYTPDLNSEEPAIDYDAFYDTKEKKEEEGKSWYNYITVSCEPQYLIYSVKILSFF